MVSSQLWRSDDGLGSSEGTACVCGESVALWFAREDIQFCGIRRCDEDE